MIGSSISIDATQIGVVQHMGLDLERERWLLCPATISHQGCRAQYVGPRELAKLYGVDIRDCMVHAGNKISRAMRGATQLHPRPDGVYRKPDGSPNV